MDLKYAKLFEPFKINNLEIKNRIVMSPMDTKSELENTIMSDETITYYSERAKGGVGAIFTYAHYVDCGVEISPILESPFARPELFTTQIKKLLAQLHKYDTKLFVQLWSGFGRIAFPFSMESDLVAPSECGCRWDLDNICRELTTEEVKRMVDATIEAAVICKNAGVDGVDVCSAYGGYMGDQFLTDAFNHRTDEYGGSMDGKLKMLLDIIKGIREKCGDDYPVTVRFSTKHHMKAECQGHVPGEDYKEYGRDIEESVEMGKRLVAAGYNAFLIGNGCYDSLYWQYPPMYQKEGLWLDDVAPLTAAVDVPVICAGKLTTPALANEAIRTGKITAAAMGRALLADPQLPNKAKEGKDEEICPCIGCNNGCMARVMNAQPILCAVNPDLLRESQAELIPASKPKKIAVIGGGIAGMEVARIAALRGHDVTIYEKDSHLGGVFVPASIPKEKVADRRLLAWFENQLKKTGVKVNLNYEIKIDKINELDADKIIVATGTEPKVPPIPGIDGKNVLNAIPVFLEEAEVGEKVAIIGGGQVGCELALWLEEKGKNPFVIEALSEIMGGGIVQPPEMNRIMIQDMLNFKGIKVMCKTKVTSITETSVEVATKSGNESVRADTVILAIGYKPNTCLYDAIKANTDKEVYLVGDAKQVGNVMTAVHSGAEVGKCI